MKDKKFIPNSYQTPNAIVDELAAILSDKAFKIYHIIVRKTLGWNKEKDSISTTQLMELSNTKKKDTIYKAVDELVHYGLVRKIKIDGKSNNYAIDFSHIEEVKNIAKPVPLNGITTSTKKEEYQKKGLVPLKATTLDLINGTTTSPTKRDTQTNNIKHKEITTTTTIDMENIDKEAPQQKSKSVSGFPFSFNEVTQLANQDHELVINYIDYNLKSFGLSEIEIKNLIKETDIDILDEAVSETNKANLEKRIETTRAKFFYGVLRNIRARASA